MIDDLNKPNRRRRTTASMRDGSTQQTQITESPNQKRAPNRVAGFSDCLVIIYSTHSSEYGKKIVLNKTPLSIGREGQCELILQDEVTSRKHCTLELRPEGWIVSDLSSTNGTFINDELVEVARLLPGDLLRVGHTIFKYLSGSDIEAQYHETIYRMTITDGLTGAYNKRFFLEVLEKELSRAKRYGRPLCTIMLDIDHFKVVNDTYGHLAGDAVLKELSRTLRHHLRDEDTFARYGGEEFAIILPETSREAARLLLNRVRLIVQQKKVTYEDQLISVTFSAGIAERKDNDTPTQLLTRADEQLYHAKHNGRNCIVAESES